MLHISAIVSTRNFIRSVVSLTVVAVALLTGVVAHAQPLTLTSGPYEIVADENVGEYRVIVHQSPARVIVGTLTYAVQVQTKVDGANIPDAVVKVYATPSEHGAKQVAPALNSPADREYYVGRLEIEEAGVWAIDVVVEHPEFGTETLILATEVHDRARGGSNLIFGTFLWVLVSIVFVGVTWYLVRKSKQAQIKLESIRKSRNS